MKSIKFLAIAFLVPSIFIFTSCMDYQIPEASDEALLSEIEEEVNTTSVGEEAFSNAEALVNAFIMKSSSKVNGMQKIVSDYPYVTKISVGNEFPRVYEINFGNVYDPNDDSYISPKRDEDMTISNEYRGSITYTKYSYKQSEFRYNEFYIGNDKVEGYKKGDVLVKGVLNLISDIRMTNVTTKLITYYKYEERTRTVIDNNNTENDYTDDSYSITGNTKGFYISKVKGGINYNFIISEERPLIKLSGWKYFVSGSTFVDNGGIKETYEFISSTDYGHGELDNIATREYKDGKSRKIFLKW